MHLTDYEKQLLGGDCGPEAAKLMQIMLKIGEFEGAEDLVTVSNVHLASTQILAISGQGGMDFITRLAESGLTFRAMTTTNPVSIDLEKYDELGIAFDYATWQMKSVAALKKLRAFPSFTCTPYYSGFLHCRGDHLAWVETSAVIFANSYFGARTNRNVDVAALASALCGRTPCYGMHLEANRPGQVLVTIRADLSDIADYGALGNYVGKRIGARIPVFADQKIKPSIENLVHMGAALATAAPIPLYHFFGVTPEVTTDPLRYGKQHVTEEIIFGRNELTLAKEELLWDNGAELDFVALGCPHYSPEKVRYVASLLEGKQIRPNITVWVCMSQNTKLMLERTGEVETIESSGAHVVADTCMCICNYATDTYKKTATDSAKAAYYLAANNLGVEYGTTKECIEAAIRGYWS
ncbi:MAG: aconitase X catalytic domain-containing protein [Gracilibacteraceae bacterium]|nr:aconitase X catalytic domain-containing protein [Gracilibacteraceae bacterium]